MAVYVGDKIAEPKYILIGNKSVYRVYLGDELVWEKDYAVSAPYGFLYNNYAVEDVKGIAPSGWHVPSLAEYIALFGIDEEEEGVGGTLKGTATKPDAHPRWESPNVGATNSLSFDGYGGGYREDDGTFDQHGYKGMWWTSDGYFFGLANDSSDYFYGNTLDPRYGLSVRLIKDDDVIGGGTMEDNDGNVYNTVLINGAVWMKENLRVISFADTNKIINVVEDIDWKGLSTSAYCIYNYEVIDKKPIFHNKLNGLQGGKEFDEYYHLTQAEYESLCSVPSGGTTGQTLIKASDDDCDLTWGDAGGELDIPSLDPKTTPVDADLFVGADSEDTFINKKFTWANIKSTLKTYFDGIYATITSLANYVTLGTTQEITGYKTFRNIAGGIYLRNNTPTKEGFFIINVPDGIPNGVNNTLSSPSTTSNTDWILPVGSGTLALTSQLEWQADTNGVKLVTDADNVGIGAGSDSASKLYVKSTANANGAHKTETESVVPYGQDIILKSTASALAGSPAAVPKRVYRRQTQTTLDGIGVTELYLIQNDVGEDYIAAQVQVVLTDVSDGAEKSEMGFYLANNRVIYKPDGGLLTFNNIELSEAVGSGSGNNGNWQFAISGGNLVFQKRESGVWVTKQTISA